MESEVMLASQAEMDSRAREENLVHLVHPVNLEFQDQSVSQDHRVHSGSREREDQQDQLEMLETQDVQERRGTRARREPVETREPSVNLELKENQVQ